MEATSQRQEEQRQNEEEEEGNIMARGNAGKWGRSLEPSPCLRVVTCVRLTNSHWNS